MAEVRDDTVDAAAIDGECIGPGTGQEEIVLEDVDRTGRQCDRAARQSTEVDGIPAHRPEVHRIAQAAGPVVVAIGHEERCGWATRRDVRWREMLCDGQAICVDGQRNG